MYMACLTSCPHLRDARVMHDIVLRTDEMVVIICHLPHSHGRKHVQGHKRPRQPPTFIWDIAHRKWMEGKAGYMLTLNTTSLRDHFSTLTGTSGRQPNMNFMPSSLHGMMDKWWAKSRYKQPQDEGDVSWRNTTFGHRLKSIVILIIIITTFLIYYCLFKRSALFEKGASANSPHFHYSY